MQVDRLGCAWAGRGRCAAGGSGQIAKGEIVVGAKLEVADLAAGLDPAYGSDSGSPRRQNYLGQGRHDDKAKRGRDEYLDEREPALAAHVTCKRRFHLLTLMVSTVEPTWAAPGQMVTAMDHS